MCVCLLVFCNMWFLFVCVWACVFVGVRIYDFVMCGRVYLFIFLLCVRFFNTCVCIHCVVYCLYRDFSCFVYVYVFLFYLSVPFSILLTPCDN